MANAPIVLFLHIPKAGGSTFSDFIYNSCCVEPYYVDADDYLHAGVYYFPVGFFREEAEPLAARIIETLQRDDLRAVVGHFWYGVHSYLSGNFCYVTLLRDPVERAISLYYHLKLTNVMSFDEFITSSPYREVDNGQTRRISGEDPEIGQCTSDMLQLAKQNLSDHFGMVGITERFEESAALLKHAMGWTGEINYYPRNKNPGRPPAKSLSSESLGLIRERHALDVELYTHACDLLDKAVSTYGSALATDIRHLQAKAKQWLTTE